MKNKICAGTLIALTLALWQAGGQCGTENQGGQGLELQLRQSRQELSLAKQSYDHLQELYLAKEAEGKKLSEKIAGFIKDFQALQALTERLKKDKEDLEAAQDKLIARIKDLEKQKAGVSEQEKKPFQDRIRELEQKSASADQEKRQLSEKLNKAEAVKSSTADELLRLKKQPDLKPELDRLNSEKRQLSEKLDKAEAAKSSAADELLQLKKQPDLKPELDRIRQELARAKEENDRLEKESKATEDMRRQAGQSISERKAMQQETDRLHVQLDALTQQLRDTKDKLTAQFKSENESEVKALSYTIEGLKKDLKAAQDLSYQLVQEKAAQQSKEKEGAARSKDQEDRMAQSEKLNRDLSDRIQELEKENSNINELRRQKEQAEARLVQETALLKTDLEQQLAQKDGELLRLNTKLSEAQGTRQAELAALTARLEGAQKETATQRDLAYKLFQEKSVSEGSQAQSGQKLKDLENARTMLQQEKDKLVEQNAFLKNQYVGISQELNSLRDQYARELKEKNIAPVKADRKDVEAARKELAEKAKDYNRQLGEYEDKLKNKEDLEKQNKSLLEDFAKLKEAYGKLEEKYKETDEARQRHEQLQERYAQLPQENTTLHYNLGVLYAQNQDYKRAVTEFEKVLELKPDDTETLYNLGVIYGEYLNQRTKAIALFKRYLALVPDDADAQRVRKYILTWETYEQDMKNGK